MNHETNTPEPNKPDEGQTLQPRPNPEINPGEKGSNTEVDLDKEKTKTYPGTTPPERH